MSTIRGTAASFPTFLLHINLTFLGTWRERSTSISSSIPAMVMGSAKGLQPGMCLPSGGSVTVRAGEGDGAGCLARNSRHHAPVETWSHCRTTWKTSHKHMDRQFLDTIYPSSDDSPAMVGMRACSGNVRTK